MLALQTMSDEMEREKTRQRVIDAMTRKAKAGHATGGRCYGYDNLEVHGLDGRRSHVTRKVNETEAVTVRRIFEMCAAGKGVKTIAKTLNADGAPAPRPHPNRPRAWAPSSVRAILHRPTYRGETVWAKTKKCNRWGQQQLQKRPKSEWLSVSQPELRIVSDELWDATHRRLTASAATYLRSTNGHMWGRPPTGVESKYLLSGFLQCACCGASMTVRTRGRGRQRYFYVCASYDHRGQTVCANGMPLPMDAADDAVLTKLEDYVLDPDVIEGAILDAVQELRPSRAASEARRMTLKKDLRQVDKEQDRLVAAVSAGGGPIEALTRALRDREQQRARILHDLVNLDGEAELSEFDVQAVQKDLRSRVDEWRGMLRRQTPLSRQVVGRLLDGRITWKPRRSEGIYEFSGKAKLDKLLSGLVVTRGMVAVRGIEPRFDG
jgi:site-specific DNA recombinase